MVSLATRVFMQTVIRTLFIGPEPIHRQIELRGCLWSASLPDALRVMARESIDAIVIDDRDTDQPALKDLLANLPVTTRVLALVERMPDDPMCIEAGVVFLTPPINFADIDWFVRAGAAAMEEG